jgi:hypothetical protein
MRASFLPEIYLSIYLSRPRGARAYAEFSHQKKFGAERLLWSWARAWPAGRRALLIPERCCKALRQKRCFPTSSTCPPARSMAATTRRGCVALRMCAWACQPSGRTTSRRASSTRWPPRTWSRSSCWPSRACCSGCCWEALSCASATAGTTWAYAARLDV